MQPHEALWPSLSGTIDAFLYWQGYQGEWLWSGTSDVSALLSVPAALYVVNGIGREKWMLHNAKLLKKAASLLHTAFGTEHVLGGLTMQPCMPQMLAAAAANCSFLGCDCKTTAQLRGGRQGEGGTPRTSSPLESMNSRTLPIVCKSCES